ncbi:hypothetical protein D9757_008593 [Collybiopsis confluens]|uniref:Hydrophobin n=1 Tax=Collybiopsis confluens TaxID=2823264 RepID=A0A8H5HMZ5_9AGAR|nr:hypothetical protein D9757_008593 [Collybiopsis confluens]
MSSKSLSIKQDLVRDPGTVGRKGRVKLAFISAALATLVVATPTPRDDELASSCTTGSLQCCNSVFLASNPTVVGLLGLLGIEIQDLDLLVGLTCSPITAGSNCNGEPVCCEDNSHGSLIAIDCVPAPP